MPEIHTRDCCEETARPTPYALSALGRLTDDFNQLRADREAQMRREEQERDQMYSQLEAEDKMRLGVEEYRNKLVSEMESVGRQLVSERKKNQVSCPS